MTSCLKKGVPHVTWERGQSAITEQIKCQFSKLPTRLRTHLVFVLLRFRLPARLRNSTKVPPLSLCELDFEREKKRSKVTMLWLLMFSSSHILFLTLVWVFFCFISYISPWNSLVCVSTTPYFMPDSVTLLSQFVLLLYISHTLSSLFHPLTCLTLHPSSVCHPCKGPAYKIHASSWPCVV